MDLSKIMQMAEQMRDQMEKAQEEAARKAQEEAHQQWVLQQQQHAVGVSHPPRVHAVNAFQLFVRAHIGEIRQKFPELPVEAQARASYSA